MTDKKTFGSFIKTKRMEKNYSQKDLAEMLFVTEGAVSKWKRHLIDRRIKTDLYFRRVGEQITAEWRLIYGT